MASFLRNTLDEVGVRKEIDQFACPQSDPELGFGRPIEVGTPCPRQSVCWRRGECRWVESAYDAMRRSAARGDVNMIRFALRRGAYPKSISLYDAVDNGREDVVAAFIESGLDPIDYSNALYRASEHGHAGVAKMLLDNGDLDEGAKARAFSLAADNGREDVVAAFIESGGLELNYSVALYYASDNGHAGVVKMLLDSGVNENAKARVFYLAADNGREDVVAAFIESGLDPIHYSNALYRAARNGHAGVAKMLLDSGNLDEGAKADAFDVAQRNGHTNVMLLFQSNRFLRWVKALKNMIGRP